MRRRLDALVEVGAPAVLLFAVCFVGLFMSSGTKQDFISALVNATIVIALYVFIGNSGVISFGHISFVALGAFAAGLMTIETIVKPNVMPDLFPFLQHHSIGNVPSLALAAGLGGLYALILGAPLMRLSGLSASIGTFAVLGITNNVLTYWDKIGPGAQTLSLVPETTDLYQAFFGALIALIVAFLYGRSRSGRLLRAAREDPPAAQSIGVNVLRHRLAAFTISGALAGLAGGLLVHQIGSITTNQVYLDLTFLTLAMLVIGGATSLWGATVGAVAVSLLNSFLSHAENGTEVVLFHLKIPSGASQLILGILMAAALIFRPNGLTGGREVSLGWLRSQIARPAPPRRVQAGPTTPREEAHRDAQEPSPRA
jgi:branched-chain amino acid transport system permease protein